MRRSTDSGAKERAIRPPSRFGLRGAISLFILLKLTVLSDIRDGRGAAANSKSSECGYCLDCSTVCAEPLVGLNFEN